MHVQELDAFGVDTFAPGDLPKLPYLEACLKEAMRLYPPGVFLLREPLTEDFHLKDITIPKGTWIHVRLLAILDKLLHLSFPTGGYRLAHHTIPKGHLDPIKTIIWLASYQGCECCDVYSVILWHQSASQTAQCRALSPWDQGRQIDIVFLCLHVISANFPMPR